MLEPGKCTNCGHVSSANEKFCSSCGYRVNNPPASLPVQSDLEVSDVAMNPMNQLGAYSGDGQESVAQVTNSTRRRGFAVAITAVIVTALAIVGSLAFKSFSEFNSVVQQVNSYIESDELELAMDVIQASSEEYGDKEDFLSLERQLEEISVSKENFLQGQDFMTSERYTNAISSFKKVVEADKLRFVEAQNLIDDASYLAVSQAIAEAKRLAKNKKYIEALSKLTRVDIFATDFEEHSTLKREIAPLAAEETRRLEEAQNAIYRSALRSMRSKRDNFRGITWYEDRSTPYYANYSSFNLYIGDSGDLDPTLRFVIRYADDDWLFVDYAEINIDGQRFDLDVFDWDRDNGSGDIWEWFDVIPTQAHMDIIEKVIDSRSAVVRFYGDDYYDDRTISSAQKRGLRNVLNALEALKRGL